LSTKNLSLYHFDGCPYCQRVRDAIGRLGIQIELRDIHKSSDRLAELRAATGKQTVPVLRIEEDGGKVRWMPESLDIVAYLEQQFAKK
jgi:glutaredoxin 2